jgi:hypothetical protein
MRMATIIGWMVALLLFSLVIVMVASKSNAQTQCGPHDRIVSVLTGKYGEVVKIEGTAGNRIIEIFVSLAGSWTLLITRSDGFSCIVAAGEGWEEVPYEPGQKS